MTNLLPALAIFGRRKTESGHEDLLIHIPVSLHDLPVARKGLLELGVKRFSLISSPLFRMLFRMRMYRYVRAPLRIVLACALMHVAYTQPGPPTDLQVEFMEDTRPDFLLHAVLSFSWAPPSGWSLPDFNQYNTIAKSIVAYFT